MVLFNHEGKKNLGINLNGTNHYCCSPELVAVYCKTYFIEQNL